MNKKTKKFMAVAASCALLTALFVVPVSAHGHHGGGRGYGQSQTTAVSTAPSYCNGGGYAVCSITDCNIQGIHQHDDTTYCNHGSRTCTGYGRSGKHCY